MVDALCWLVVGVIALFTAAGLLGLLTTSVVLGARTVVDRRTSRRANRSDTVLAA